MRPGAAQALPQEEYRKSQHTTCRPRRRLLVSAHLQNPDRHPSAWPIPFCCYIAAAEAPTRAPPTTQTNTAWAHYCCMASQPTLLLLLLSASRLHHHPWAWWWPVRARLRLQWASTGREAHQQRVVCHPTTCGGHHRQTACAATATAG